MIDPLLRQRHLMFLQANWQSLAAECFNGYLTHGRGFLIVDDGTFANRPIGVFCAFGCTYAAVGSDLFKELTNGWESNAKELSWVTEYVPETTGLFVFLRDTDKGVSSYRIEGPGDQMPILCWQRERAKKN